MCETDLPCAWQPDEIQGNGLISGFRDLFASPYNISKLLMDPLTRLSAAKNLITLAYKHNSIVRKPNIDEGTKQIATLTQQSYEAPSERPSTILDFTYDSALSSKRVSIYTGPAHVCISFRGTVGGLDFIADIAIAAGTLGYNDTHVLEAISATRNVMQKYPNHQIILTGHSLGGAVASLVGAKFNLPAITFNIGSSPVATSDCALCTHHIIAVDPISWTVIANVDNQRVIVYEAQKDVNPHSLIQFL